MNLDILMDHLQSAIRDSDQMKSIILFRRKNNKQWEWRYDIKTVKEDGSYESKRCQELTEEVKSYFANCGICKKPMTEDEDCGGDCRWCMAKVAEDPDEIANLKAQGAGAFI